MRNTSLLFVVDRSGSMSNIAREMEVAAQSVIDAQVAAAGHTTVNILQFDDRFEHYARLVSADRAKVRIDPRNQTALYQAIILGVSEFRNDLDTLPADRKPDNVMVIVITDGHENASEKAFDKLLVKDTIKFHTDNLGWDFTFLGANQDAVTAGGDMGFDTKKSMTFDATTAGVRGLSAGLSAYVQQARRGEDAQYTDEARRSASTR